jgi:aspartyl protease family protein
MIEKLLLITTIGGGLAIGLLWPTHHRPATQANGGADVALERSSDHHYYADAQVNGHAVHFLIDTGASETALTEADAQAIGLNVNPSQYQALGDGASGIVRGAYVELKTIDLNGIRQQDAKAVVVAGASVSLLGQPFLEKVDEIVIRNGEMHLKTDGKS